MFRASILVILLVGCLGCGPSTAESVVIDDPWARPTAAVAAGERGGPGAVYLELINQTANDDRLLAASSEVCDRIEIHRSAVVNDRMTMAPVVGGVELPAGSRVFFEPGGYHLMLLSLRRGLTEGDRFPLQVVLERSGTVEVEVQVRLR